MPAPGAAAGALHATPGTGAAVTAASLQLATGFMLRTGATTSDAGLVAGVSASGDGATPEGAGMPATALGEDTAVSPLVARPEASPPFANADAMLATKAPPVGPEATFANALDAVAGDPGVVREQADAAAPPVLGPGALPSSSAAKSLPPALAQPMPLPASPDSGFDDGFGARIGWMAEQGIGRAELRVMPDSGGPIDVRLQIDGTRISAEFSSANADVRQALEASMGRLREMLGQQGMQLAQSDVGQGRPGGSQPAPRSMGDGGTDDLTAVDPSGLRPLPMRGLLDEYA
ncbi:MAG: flagellar hook-length control protein FliK [Pseudomonadota bacterium]|nr:flagellar hook-length control protein FliK [Pseudomonadota bacterium]